MPNTTMTTLLPILSYFSVQRWTGPIFHKELRVSSRRRRNYALRFMYLIVLLVFIAVV